MGRDPGYLVGGKICLVVALPITEIVLEDRYKLFHFMDV